MPAVFTTTTTHPLRRAVPAIVGAAIVLAACGGGGDSTDRADSGSEVVDTAGEDDPTASAGGIEPAAACGLLDASAVDALLGTSGVTTAVDASLGFYDGCRWATAPTDVPALIVGYDGTMAFEQARDLACSDTTPEPAAAAGADAVACFGAVIAPAGSGVVIVNVDDPTGGLDDAAQVDVAARAAAAIVG